MSREEQWSTATANAIAVGIADATGSGSLRHSGHASLHGSDAADTSENSADLSKSQVRAHGHRGVAKHEVPASRARRAAQTVEAAVSSYRELFERQLGRARARLQEEREARERSAVEATQAKAKLQACEAELQSAMATIAALRAQGQPSEGLPPPRDGGPPGQVRARLPRFAFVARAFAALVVASQLAAVAAQLLQGALAARGAAAQFASPGLRYV